MYIGLGPKRPKLGFLSRLFPSLGMAATIFCLIGIVFSKQDFTNWPVTAYAEVGILFLMIALLDKIERAWGDISDMRLIVLTLLADPEEKEEWIIPHDTVVRLRYLIDPRT